jgi:hypothetical protein
MKRVLIASLVTALIVGALAYAFGWLPKDKPVPDPVSSPRADRPLEELSKIELYERAQEAGIAGRSKMSKDELIEALRTTL